MFIIVINPCSSYWLTTFVINTRLVDMVKARYCFFWQSVINNTTQSLSQYKCPICKSLPAVFLCESPNGTIRKASPLLLMMQNSPLTWHKDMMLRPVSSDNLDLIGSIFSPFARGLLSRRQPVGGVLWVRGACPTLGTAAQRRTEPCANWSGAKNKHDAVGCSLCGVADTLNGRKGNKDQHARIGVAIWNSTEVLLVHNNTFNYTMWLQKNDEFIFSNLRVKWPALGSVWLESRREAGWSAPCSKCAGRWRWWEWVWAWRQPWRSGETETCWAGWGDTPRGQRAAAERKEEAVQSIKQYRWQ